MSDSKLLKLINEIQPENNERLAAQKEQTIILNIKIAAKKVEISPEVLADDVYDQILSGMEICGTTPHVCAKQLKSAIVAEKEKKSEKKSTTES